MAARERGARTKVRKGAASGRKSGAKKAGAKKAAAKKSGAKKAAAKKAAAKKSGAKKAGAKKAAAKKAGRYTRPALRERLRRRILRGTRGGDAGQWTARKAQLLAHEYEAAGGGYRGRRTASQRRIATWDE